MAQEELKASLRAMTHFSQSTECEEAGRPGMGFLQEAQPGTRSEGGGRVTSDRPGIASPGSQLGVRNWSCAITGAVSAGF